MSKKKIPHLALVAKPAPSNVTPLPVARPEHDARVVVELLEDAAAVHLVIDGESFRVATLTGGPPNRPEVLARVARQFGEQALGEILKDQSLEDLMAWVYAQETPAAVARQAETALQARERVRQLWDLAHLEPLSVAWDEAVRRARERTDADGR